MSGRTLVSALVLVVLVAVPSAADAKGVEDARACGVDRCVDALTPDTYVVFDPMETMNAQVAATPLAPGPYYELRFRAMALDEERRFKEPPEMVSMRRRLYPETGLVRDESGRWLRVDRRATDALRRQMTGVKPFAVAKAPPREEEGGTGALPLVAAGLLVAGAAVAVGSRRRRRPSAG